jgi:hypothetical protein
VLYQLDALDAPLARQRAGLRVRGTEPAPDAAEAAGDQPQRAPQVGACQVPVGGAQRGVYLRALRRGELEDGGDDGGEALLLGGVHAGHELVHAVLQILLRRRGEETGKGRDSREQTVHYK